MSLPIEFRADDGTVLRGHRDGEGIRWGVLVHDEGHDLDSWSNLVQPLRTHGLCVLAFDLRGHGLSDDPWDPARAPGDVLAACWFAESQGAERIALLGEGAGATAALVAAGDYPARAVVALSPRPELDGVASDAIRGARAPKLIVVGSTDRQAFERAQTVQRRSIGWTVLESPPVEEQGADLLASAWGDHVREHLLAFLRKSL